MLTQQPEVVHIPDVPLAFNICGQMLREIGFHDDSFSVAHVVMNPGAYSLLHHHTYMEELYVITRGTGILTVGESVIGVAAGDAVTIPQGTPHRLANAGIGLLEHLVLAAPPFDPDDVITSEAPYTPPENFETFNRPKLVSAFDGASLVEYEFFLSTVAFGFTPFAEKCEKRPHFHNHTEEWIFVIDGKGTVELDGQMKTVGPGDLVKVPPRVRHAVRSTGPADIIVVCVSYPGFSPDDTFYD